MVLVAMCGLSGVSPGLIINAAGVFFVPIAEELGTGRGNVAFAMALAGFFSGVGGLFVPILLKRISARIMILIGGLMTVCGTVLLSFSHSLTTIYALSIFLGLGSGLLHFVTVTFFINNWFQVKHGFATGVAIGAAGIVGAAASPLLTAVILASSWRTGYIVMAILMAILIAPAVLLPITYRPEESGLLPLGASAMSGGSVDIGAAGQKASGQTVAGQSAVNRKTPLPLVPLLSILIFSALANLIIGYPPHLPGFALSLGFTEALGALLLSICLMGNIASKVIHGALSDQIGARRSIYFICIITGVAEILLILHPGAWAMCAGSLFLGFAYANSAVGRTLFVKDLLGNEGFKRINPVITFIGTTANAVSSTFYGFLYDVTGSYVTAIYLCFTFTAVLIGCVTIAYRYRAHHTGQGTGSAALGN